MGCAPSSTPAANEKKARKQSLQRALRKASIFTRRQKVSVRIGESVKLTDSMPKVVFSFGGPGTKKGRILSDLSHVFGFKLINVENIIQDELAKKLEDPVQSNLTASIHQLIKNDPDMLRLDWVMRQIVYVLDEMEEDNLYIVDFMPNLKLLLNNETFIKDCITEFKYFESKYPISFAMNFVIPPEKLKQKVEIECTKHPGKPKDQPSAQSDEADFSRTQKRATVFQNSVKHFLDYFNKHDKVVTVDVSCGELDAIWSRVCDFFYEMDFKPHHTVDNVILFHFGEDYITDSLKDYRMDKKKLSEIVEDPNDAIEKLVESICRYVDSKLVLTRSFAFDCSGTSLSKQSATTIQKQIPVFVEQESCGLHRFAGSFIPAPEPIKVKVLSSLDCEICLFPTDTDPLLCCWIIRNMRENRER